MRPPSGVGRYNNPNTQRTAEVAMNLHFITQTGRNLDRLREIVGVLARYGLADWLARIDARWVQNLLRRAVTDQLTGATTEARVRMALADLGTTFIKFGQILSTRPDLVGPALATELAELQVNAPADPIETIRKTILDELGRPTDEIFDEFEPTPVASASIAQVHRARLKTGERVAVKVQHPDIVERINSDLDILKRLAEWAESYSTQLRLYQPTAAVAQLRETLLGELDFRQERRNLDRFGRNFAGDARVRFPRVFAEHSGRRVLTMEWLDGVPGADLDKIRATGHDPAVVARTGANVYLDMVFRDAFYHADPHPGNFLVLPAGVLGILDCGMVGRIDGEMRDEIEAILLAVVTRDTTRLTDAVIRVGALPPDFNRVALNADLDGFLAEYAEVSLEELDLGAALHGITEIIRAHRILLPPSLSLLLRLFIMLDGTGRQLNADFSLAEVLQPYYAKILARRFSPRQILRDLHRYYRDWSRLAQSLPREVIDVLRKVSSGAVEIHMEHRRLERTVDRLVQGVLIAAMLVTSGTLWASNVEPTVYGVSVVGAAGYLLAVLLWLRLLWTSRGRDKDDVP
jgi:ubiquinone biosynthesis protein